jgi:tRNA pseudouridine55 synthase
VPRDEIAARLSSFVGIVDQVPPRISAVKIQGRRAHALERKGADFELLPRPVIIETIEILDYDWPTLTLRIRCGKGTYIRSIARDLGERLGVGGYIETLHRDYVGVFRTEDAIPYPKIADWRDYWLPMTRAVEHYPQYLLSDDQADRIRYGQRIPIEAPVGRIAARRDDDLVALGSVEDGEFRPTTVFSAHG